MQEKDVEDFYVRRECKAVDSLTHFLMTQNTSEYLDRAEKFLDCLRILLDHCPKQAKICVSILDT